MAYANIPKREVEKVRKLHYAKVLEKNKCLYMIFR